MNGTTYYHTNVVPSVGEHWAIWCPDAMPLRTGEKELEHLRQLGKEQITITRKQLGILRQRPGIENESGSKLLAVSSTAWDAFMPQQQHQLRRYCTPLIFQFLSSRKQEAEVSLYAGRVKRETHSLESKAKRNTPMDGYTKWIVIIRADAPTRPGTEHRILQTPDVVPVYQTEAVTERSTIRLKGAAGR